MYSHECYHDLHLRMDLFFTLPRTAKQNRIMLFSCLKIALKYSSDDDTRYDGSYMEFCEYGNVCHKALTEENIGMLEVLFAEENSIDNIRFFISNPKNGQDYPAFIQYNDLGSKGIQSLIIARRLELKDFPNITKYQNNFKLFMMSMYQGLFGINANMGLNGSASNSIDNVFEKYSSLGKCDYHTLKTNTRGAFWSTILSSDQLLALGGIEQVKRAVDFATVEMMRQIFPSRTNPYLVEYEDFAVCTLSDRMDECPFEKLRALYQLFRSKDMVPDVARLHDASQEDANFLRLLNADI